MRPIVVAVLCALSASVAVAKEGNECIIAAGTVAPDFALPNVARAIAKNKLDIAVIGSASSELNGPAGTNIAYPTWLEKTLRGLLPGVTVKVTTYARARDTASEMEAKLARIISESAPALVVWQTGTADALLGVAAEDFQTTLEEAVDKLHSGGADVVFMNMQFSPRTDAVLSTEPYSEALRWVGLERAVNLFDRQAVMRQWDELGTFDLLAATKSLDTAAKVHDCIGRLLADLVLQGVAAVGDENREKTSQ